MIKRAFFAVGLGIALYLLIPRLGGLGRDAAELRHAHLWLMILGVVVEIASLGAYVLLYRHLLSSEGAQVKVRAAVTGVMAGFLVSHVVPGGSAAGTVVNVKAMEREGVNARTTGVALVLTVVLSDIALAGLFFVGILYSFLKNSIPVGYVATAIVILPLLAGLVGLVFLFAYRPAAAARALHRVARALHRVIKRIDADKLERSVLEVADEARAALSGRRFAIAIGLALANWVLDISVLYLFFLAVGHHQHFGALIVAYAVANIAAAIPLTPSGLGIIEATLVGISVGFGAPRAVAVVAVLGYRLVNFWLPLPAGLVAYVRAQTSQRPAVSSG